MSPKKILWIEDNAETELAELLGPVYHQGGYLLELAPDATVAVRTLIQNKKYDGVIVDIRLPPGHDPLWQKLYNQTVRGTVETQLGLLLLYWMLNVSPLKEIKTNTSNNSPSDQRILKKMQQKINQIKSRFTAPAWLGPEQVAIFSIERDTQLKQRGHLERLGITHYQQKAIAMPDDILLKIIKNLVSHHKQ